MFQLVAPTHWYAKSRFQVGKSFYETTRQDEKALSGLFIAGTAGIQEEMKSTPNPYIEAIVAVSDNKETFAEVFYQRIERKKKSTLLMDPFTSCTLSLLRFMRPVENFVKSRREENG